MGLPASIKTNATLISALSAAVLSASAVASELAGFWSFPRIVTEDYLVEVMDTRVNQIVTVILDERAEVAEHRARLRFQLTQAEFMLGKLEEGDEDWVRQQLVISQLAQELEIL